MFQNLELMFRIADTNFAERVRVYVDGEVADSGQIAAKLHEARATPWRWVKQMVA